MIQPLRNSLRWKFGFDRRQILEGYMVLGGVAYYWSLLREGQSMTQNFNRLFFGQSNELGVEFDRVFKSCLNARAVSPSRFNPS